MSNVATKNPSNALFMDEISFLMCAPKLRLDTGEDLETVGLRAEFNGVAISIKGDQVMNYAVDIYEYAILQDGKWVAVHPTLGQRKSLQGILNREVDKINDSINESIEKVWQRIDDENMAERFGREDTLYNSTY